MTAANRCLTANQSAAPQFKYTNSIHPRHGRTRHEDCHVALKTFSKIFERNPENGLCRSSPS